MKRDASGCPSALARRMRYTVGTENDRLIWSEWMENNMPPLPISNTIGLG